MAGRCLCFISFNTSLSICFSASLYLTHTLSLLSLPFHPTLSLCSLSLLSIYISISDHFFFTFIPPYLSIPAPYYTFTYLSVSVYYSLCVTVSLCLSLFADSPLSLSLSLSLSFCLSHSLSVSVCWLFLSRRLYNNYTTNLFDLFHSIFLSSLPLTPPSHTHTSSPPPLSEPLPIKRTPHPLYTTYHNPSHPHCVCRSCILVFLYHFIGSWFNDASYLHRLGLCYSTFTAIIKYRISNSHFDKIIDCQHKQSNGFHIIS